MEAEGGCLLNVKQALSCYCYNLEMVKSGSGWKCMQAIALNVKLVQSCSICQEKSLQEIQILQAFKRDTGEGQTAACP